MVRISIGFVDLILRGVYKFGTACDLLIVIALAAQAWLLFLPTDKCQ